MHEKSPVLSAEKRERIGSRYAARDRAKGKLPAVVYGHGKEPMAITLDSKDALTHIMKGEKVFRLELKGAAGGDNMVLLKDIQYGYLGNNPVHCDFARVDLNERVKTKVHINLVGEAIGLKQAGAILVHPVNEIEIECRVVDLPDEIELDINNLDLGQMITADKVKLPKDDMKLITDSHAVLAQVVLGGVTKTAEEEAAAAAPATPEVITAKKPEEGAAAGAAGAKDAKGGAAAPAKGAAPAGGDKKK